MPQMEYIELYDGFSIVSLFFSFFQGHSKISPKAISHLAAAVWELCPVPA